MKKYLAFLITFVLLNPVLDAQDLNKSIKVKEAVHLYILMGQSNMAGRGEITETFKAESHPRVFMLNKDNKWVPAHHPLHFDKSVAGVGPGLSFARYMANQDTGVFIGLIPCAVGGTSIRNWQPNGYDSVTKTHPYDDAIIRIKEGMKSGVINGMLWHQGESDSNPAAAINYVQRLQILINSIRMVTGNPSLPVVAGELGRYKVQYQTINDQLKDLPAAVPGTAIASSEGLTHKGDNTHFDSKSAEILGERFAGQMVRLKRELSIK